MPPRPDPLVVFQTSDWHVGSPLTGQATWPEELKETRRQEVDAAAERAVNAARTAEADLMLVPGDLWDAESVPPASIHRLLDALASFAPRPVFVAPGNHDFVGPGAWYDPSVLASLGMRSWPENVVVFKEPHWTEAAVPGRSDARVVGRAFLSPAVTAERPFARRPARPQVPYALLALHGSLESYAGPDAPRGAKLTAPFTREELLGAGFTWAALGHHHHVEIVDDDSGVSRAAYSGCPTGRGFDEIGQRFFLRVTLIGAAHTVVELVPADTRIVRDVTLDVTGLESKDLLDRASSAFEREGVAPGDLVRLTLTGEQAYGARPGAVLAALSGRHAHLALRDRTARPSPVEAAGPSTAEGRFVNELLQRRGAPGADVALVDLALRLGRDALAGRALGPPEIEE